MRTARATRRFRVIRAVVRAVVFVCALTAIESACTSDSRIAPVDAGSHLIVVASRDDAIEEIEPNGGRVRDHAETEDGPERVAVSRDGRFAVATNYGAKSAGHTLSVYDLVERRREPTIELAPYSRPYDVAFIDRRSTVLVSAESSNVVLEVALRGGRILRAIPSGGDAPRALCVSPDKRRAFVANARSGSVSSIDVSRGVVDATVEVGRGPSGFAWVAPERAGADDTRLNVGAVAANEATTSANAAQLWVALADEDTLLVLDPATLAIQRRLTCPGSPRDLSAAPDGSVVVIALARTDEIALFSARDAREIARLPARRALDLSTEAPGGSRLDSAPRGSPTRVLVEPESHYAFVSMRDADLVAVVDLAARAFRGVYSCGRSPAGLAWAFRRESFAFLSDGADR